MHEFESQRNDECHSILGRLNNGLTKFEFLYFNRNKLFSKCQTLVKGTNDKLLIFLAN